MINESKIKNYLQYGPVGITVADYDGTWIADGTFDNFGDAMGFVAKYEDRYQIFI